MSLYLEVDGEPKGFRQVKCEAKQHELEILLSSLLDPIGRLNPMDNSQVFLILKRNICIYLCSSTNIRHEVTSIDYFVCLSDPPIWRLALWALISLLGSIKSMYKSILIEAIKGICIYFFIHSWICSLFNYSFTHEFNYYCCTCVHSLIIYSLPNHSFIYNSSIHLLTYVFIHPSFFSCFRVPVPVSEPDLAVQGPAGREAYTVLPR